MPRLKASPPTWFFFAALSVAAFALNWLWEVVQMPAYEAPARAWASTAFAHVVPSLGDVALTFAVYGVCALAAGRWRLLGAWNEYAAAGLLGGACAVAYEWKAIASGWWSYSSHMPVVAFLGVGLWPMLQLTLLVPFALWVATRWGRRRGVAVKQVKGTDPPAH